MTKFKEEVVKLSNEIGVNKAAKQLDVLLGTREKGKKTGGRGLGSTNETGNYQKKFSSCLFLGWINIILRSSKI